MTATLDSRMLATARLTTRVLTFGAGEAVLFLHGNTSNADWWRSTLLALPPGFMGVALDQRGYGAADRDQHINATLGLADLADDALAVLDALGVDKFHAVGHSLGGMVVWQLLHRAAPRLLTVTQVAPGSPFGFGGTKDADGAPCWPDFAGSGGGLTNKDLLARLAAGDRSLEAVTSPRTALRFLITKAPFIAPEEDLLLTAMLSTHLGERDLPGDAVPSPNWPFTAPGVWGAANALSPKYAPPASGLYALAHKPPILWVRGADDLLVSDQSASDPGALGAMGLIPGWPGVDVYPPQPMLAQTRAVLTRYAAAGGAFREVVLADCGHTPFIEKPAEFNAAFHTFLRERS